MCFDSHNIHFYFLRSEKKWIRKSGIETHGIDIYEWFFFEMFTLITQMMKKDGPNLFPHTIVSVFQSSLTC